MPNNQTNLQAYLNDHLTEMRDSAAAEHNRLLSAYVNQLKKLNDRLQSFYTRQNGQYKAASQSDLNSLVGEYRNALRQCNAYLAQNREDPTATIIKTILNQDLNELRGLRAEKGVSLPAALERARGTTISIHAKDINTVGGMMNSRIPVSYVNEDGELVEGFFTKPSHHYSKKHDLKIDILQSLPLDFPQFSTLIRKAETDEDFLDRIEKLYERNILSVYQSGETKELQFSNENSARSFYSSAKAVLAESGDPAFANLSEDSDLFKQIASRFFDFLKYYSDTLSHREAISSVYGESTFDIMGGQRGIEADDGSRIDSRNTGMSAVAHLLGCDEVLAKSEPMTLEIDGVSYSGTFMAKTKGHPIKQLPKTNALYLLKNPNPDDSNEFDEQVKDLYDTNALKQLAVLQTLDYICGNVDRHSNNLSLIFSGEPGHEMVSGVQGYDNDLSFGKAAQIKTGVYAHLTSPDKLLVLPESVANAIEHMKKPELMLALRTSGLSEAEMEAAWDRANDVKRQIAAGREAFPKDFTMNSFELRTGVIRVVSDDKWNNISPRTLTDAMNKATNNEPPTLFNYMLSNSLGVASQEEPTQFAQGERVAPELNRDTLANAAKKIEEVYNTLKKVSSVFYGSQQFDDLYETIKGLRKTGRTMAENPNPQEYKQYYDTVQTAMEQTTLYLNNKIGENRDQTQELSSIGKDRVEAVETVAQKLREVEITLYEADQRHAAKTQTETILTSSAPESLQANYTKKANDLRQHAKTLGEGAKKDFAKRALQALSEALPDGGEFNPEKAAEAMASMIAYERELRSTIAHMKRPAALDAALRNPNNQQRIIDSIRQEPAFAELTANLTADRLKAFVANNGERSYFRQHAHNAPKPAPKQEKAAEAAKERTSISSN